MSELLALARDYASPVNSLLLIGILWALQALRADVKDIRDNHLPHIYERLGHIEGVNEGLVGGAQPRRDRRS